MLLPQHSHASGRGENEKRWRCSLLHVAKFHNTALT
jgi:hypothetical protein